MNLMIENYYTDELCFDDAVIADLHIECAHCGFVFELAEAYKGDEIDSGITEAGRQVTNAGWKKIDGSVYCEECAENKINDALLDTCRDNLRKILNSSEFMMQLVPALIDRLRANDKFEAKDLHVWLADTAALKHALIDGVESYVKVCQRAKEEEISD